MAAYRRRVIDRPGTTAWCRQPVREQYGRCLIERILMLTFDFSTARFLLDDVAIGRGTRAQDMDTSLPSRFSDVPGQPGYRNFDGRSGDLNIALGFRDGLPRPGAWEQREEKEAWRRAQHEAIMRSLFGAMRYETRDLVVDLVREPRNRTEQLRFVVPR